MNEKNDHPEPDELLPQESEACNTNEKPSPTDKTEEQGDVIGDRWWTWHEDASQWDEEIRHINKMQQKLGPLDEKTRAIRDHIGGLVPCDSGFPVTVDELLNAIGRGELNPPVFRNGCWGGAPYETQATQSFQIEAMTTIQAVLQGYLQGKRKEEIIGRFPSVRGFIERNWQWLGPREELTQAQKLMLERALLPFEYFAKQGHGAPRISWRDNDPELCERVYNDCMKLDKEISTRVDLPPIHPSYHPEFQENLKTISNPEKEELYAICGDIAAGPYVWSDCHHNTFRAIENWIYSIGTGKRGIPTRKKGAERERLGQLRFGYGLGLDKWLLGVPMQFLLLDLGHLDLGFDTKNEILRVYVYLGEEKTAVKEWLVASLWHNIFHNPGGFHPADISVVHQAIFQPAAKAGISTREWMDSQLQGSAGSR